MMYVETAPLGRDPNAAAYVELAAEVQPTHEAEYLPIGAPAPGRRRSQLERRIWIEQHLRAPPIAPGRRQKEQATIIVFRLVHTEVDPLKVGMHLTLSLIAIRAPRIMRTEHQELDDRAGAIRSLETPTGKIAGTLLVPAATGRVPLVVIIAGSGPTDRNGNSPLLPGGNNSLKLLAEGLAERGIASLRYDKRGVAASATAMVSEANLRFDMYADDAAGWIRRLRSDARFSTITVVGHSEGSLLGMLATQRGAADGYVSIAGAGRAADKILREQLGKQLPPDLLSFSNKGLDALLAGHTVDSVPPPLLSLFRPSVQPYMIS
jgi:hypothetical protein